LSTTDFDGFFSMTYQSKKELSATGKVRSCCAKALIETSIVIAVNRVFIIWHIAV
jgi:hypothetical protein